MPAAINATAQTATARLAPVVDSGAAGGAAMVGTPARNGDFSPPNAGVVLSPNAGGVFVLFWLLVADCGTGGVVPGAAGWGFFVG